MIYKLIVESYNDTQEQREQRNEMYLLMTNFHKYFKQ